jgi:uncharacterized protein YjiS (DUF1127 family)
MRRTASGAIDTDYYQRRARAARADFLRAALSCIARCGLRAWRCIETKMAAQAIRRELAALSERELKDIGLARSEIDTVASGAYFADPTRYPRRRERLRKCA